MKDLMLETLNDGTRVPFSDVAREKLLVIVTWASWAPADPWNYMPAAGRKSPAMLHRLKSEYKKFSGAPDVTFFGISLDVDANAARAFAHKHQMPWQNYLVSNDRREEVVALLANGELPGLVLVDPADPRRNRYGVDSVLVPQTDSTASSTPLELIIQEKQAAKAAGGFARHYLGKEVIRVLEGFETAEVLELTGDHMHELIIGSVPLPPPPLLQSGQFNLPPPAFTPQPTPHTSDSPTSVGVLVEKYPIAKKEQVKTRRSAREVAKLLTDDQMVAGRGGEEALPTPKRAIVFRRGNDAVSLVYDGMLEVYLNGDRKAWLMLTTEGNEKFQELIRWLTSDAGL